VIAVNEHFNYIPVTPFRSLLLGQINPVYVVLSRKKVQPLCELSCFVDAEQNDMEHSEIIGYVGDVVWLNCTSASTIGTDVEWWYWRHSIRDPVYRNRIIQDGFQQQFTARKHSDKDYSLVISNAMFNNSGTYECIEEKGQGRTHHYLLNITGNLLFINYLL